MQRNRATPQILDYKKRAACMSPLKTNKPPVRNAKDQRATIHNNNIIITINKSYNLRGDPSARDKQQLVPHGRHPTDMENIYMPSKSRRAARNAGRNDRTKVGSKYGTQRVKPSDFTDFRTEYTPEPNAIASEDNMDEPDFLHNHDMSNSDLEVIKEGSRSKRAGVSLSKRPRAVERIMRRGPKSGAYAQFNKFVPISRRPKL